MRDDLPKRDQSGFDPVILPHRLQNQLHPLCGKAQMGYVSVDQTQPIDPFEYYLLTMMKPQRLHIL